ncbi:MAG: DUF368 domain-containing protein [bacterium]|nr:DUF368 domain-containing protein [bacterium]
MGSNKVIVCEMGNWAKKVLLGFFLGLAVIIPGVSGATIAIIFLMYEPMLNSISNLITDFKKSFLFLFPIGVGAVVGFIVGLLAISRLFLIYPIILVGLFVGLMMGALPVVFNEIKNEKKTQARVVLFVFGLVIPILVSIFALLFNNNSEIGAVNITALKLVFYFILGVLISLTQIIPGLSATALLIAVNEYSFILSCLHFSAIKDNPKIILLFLALVIGFILGLIIFSKVIDKILKTNKQTAFFMISGLSISSIISIAISPEVVDGVNKLAGQDLVIQVLLSIVLMAAGVMISSFILKKKKQN